MNPIIKRRCSMCGRMKPHYMGRKRGVLKPLSFCKECRSDMASTRWMRDLEWRKKRLREMAEYNKMHPLNKKVVSRNGKQIR